MSRRSLLAIAGLLGACSPITPYRTSVGVPTVAPTTAVGAPIAGGTLGLGGYASGSALGVGNLSPDVGDPGLYESPYAFGGWARVGLADAIELGVSGDYAPGDAMRQGAAGVLEIPGDDSVSAVSLWLTGGYMWGDVGFGATVEGSRMSMPYARFEYTGPEKYLHDGVYLGDDPDSLYELYERGRVNPIRIRSTGALQIRKGPVEAAVGIGFCPVFTNNGFSVEEVPVYRAGGVAVGPVADLGYDFGALRLGGQAWFLSGSRGPTRGFDEGFGGRVMVELRPIHPKGDAAEGDAGSDASSSDEPAAPTHHPAP